MLMRIHNALVSRGAPFVLGKHPDNTIFSFNFFPIRHIRKFMRDAAGQLKSEYPVIVDVGGGAAPFYRYFAGNVARYIVVDMQSTEKIERPAGVEFRVGFAESLPIDDAFADVVICNQVLEHVVDVKRSVEECHRVLRPGGLYLGSVPHICTLHLEPDDFRRFTMFGVEQFLKREGFEELTIEKSGSVYSTTAYLLGMDWMLGSYRIGEPQGFSMKRAFWMAPLVGFINSVALVAEKLLPDTGRTPANFCWAARKSIKTLTGSVPK